MTIESLFQKAVKDHAEKPALEHGSEELSYYALNEKANALAQLLIEKGVKKNEPVGISAERSFDLIIGVLAIIKAGGAYMPIDALYPEDRIQEMVNFGSSGAIGRRPGVF